MAVQSRVGSSLIPSGVALVGHALEFVQTRRDLGMTAIVAVGFLLMVDVR